MGMNALEVRRRVMLAQPHEAVAVGAVASFRTDVLSPLKMSFDLLPIQDLHGQANPYPPGGGKNLLNAEVRSATTSRDITSQVYADNRVTISGTASANNADCMINCTPIALASGQSVTVSWTGTDTRSTTIYVYLSSDGITYTAPKSVASSAHSATFTLSEDMSVSRILMRSNSGASVTFDCKLQIEKGSTATPYAPYSNICPITGHDGFTRTRIGANLFGGDEWLTTGQGTVDLENRTVSGGNNNGQTIPKLSLFTKYKPNTQYSFIVDFSTTATNGRPGYRFVYTDGTFENLKDAVTVANTRRVSVFTSAASKTLKYINGTAFSGTKTFYVDGCGIFEGVLTAQQFEAYKGTSIETTFPTPPGTIYGGHFVDNGDGTGTLVVDKVRIEISEVGATGTSSTGLKWGSKTLSDNGYALGAISDRYIVSSGVPSVTNRFRIVYNSTLFIFDERFTDKTTATGILAIEKPQFCYELVTPVTYTLSLDAIQSLIGQNNIWVDNADSVSVEYWGH